METDFTPLASLSGGALIGLAAVLLMLMLGRIMGATGILAGALIPAGRQDLAWRVALLAGMICGPLAYRLVFGVGPALEVPSSWVLLGVGGVLVGIGVTYAGGCTSGHGICGNARLAPRSLVATLVFMLCCFATVFVLRHVIGG